MMCLAKLKHRTPNRMCRRVYIRKQNLCTYIITPLFCFSGEYLYYSLHVLTTTTNVPSTFSKIGYVELIGENGKVVFRHKIKLNNGIGQGEFFVPVTVPSGNYKLIGYTQWMRNFGINRIFQSDIGVINPFQNNQEAIVEAPNVSEKRSPDSKRIAESEKVSDDDKALTLSVNKKVLKKRDHGSLIITARGDDEFRGNFSLSIRKIDSLEQFLAPTSIDYSKKTFKRKRNFGKWRYEKVFTRT